MTQHRVRAQRRRVWPPEEGTFAFRLARGGWRVPARIVAEGGRWHAEIDGESYPAHTDPALASFVADIWHRGIMIPQADYDWLIAVREHARKNEPSHPALHPREQIDPRRLRPLETP
jgi:hypothetical protein